MKNTILKYAFFLFYAMFVTVPLLAQPGNEGGPEEGDPDPAPIDNWVFILVLVAVTVGVYFIWKQKRKAIA